MKKQLLKIKEVAVKAKNKIMYDERGEIGIGNILSVVLVIIIFAFIIVPEGRTFVQTMFTNLKNWHTNIDLFPTS